MKLKNRKIDLPLFTVRPVKGSDEDQLLKQIEGWSRYSNEDPEFFYANTDSLTIFFWYKPGKKMVYEFILSDLALIRLKVSSMKVPQGLKYVASQDEIDGVAGGDTGAILLKALKQFGLWRPFFANGE